MNASPLAACLGALALTAGCAGTPADSRSYDCEQGGLLLVEIDAAAAHLQFANRSYTLPSVEAREGRRWREGDVLLWIRDGEASVTIGDQVVAWGCRRR